MILKTLPPPVIDIAFQSSRNQTLNPTFKPYLPQQRIIPLLIQKQLMMSPKRRVDFTMPIKIRSYGPGTVVKIQEENHAFPDMDEEADVAATPSDC